MQKLFIMTLLAAAVFAGVAHAEEMVATLLPPPVEAMIPATGQNKADPATVQVPVLKQPVQKGEAILPENITMASIPASQAFASTVMGVDELAGQQAVRLLTAGQPINRLHVRVAPAISRNQAVTILYRRGGIELSGRAQALEDGQMGQTIRVVNPATRSTLVGVIGTGGVVEIN